MKNNVKNMNKCWCYECADLMTRLSTMIVCPDCGNKRCPKATDHRLGCTKNNDPGQLGSRYGVYPRPSPELLEFIKNKNDQSS